MKGIILAGGTGSRLFPLTKVTNKHLLPVWNKPMIYYPMEKLVEAGITEIMIITGVEHMGDIVQLLGSGKEFGCHFTYRVQDEAGGIAQALGLCEIFAGNDKVVVILGDNIFKDSIRSDVATFEAGKNQAHILLKQVHDPKRFGVVEFSSVDTKGDPLPGARIVAVEEKPKTPKSNYAVVGIYFYDPSVYKIIKTLKPSNRGELEISEVNQYYVSQKTLSFGVLNGWWTDAGTFESLETAHQLAKGEKL
jgi:glucose-1-phosphate thymidylyltransferase